MNRTTDPFVVPVMFAAWATSWFVWEGVKTVCGWLYHRRCQRLYRGRYVIPRGTGEGSTWYGRANAR